MVLFVFTNALDELRIREASEWNGSAPGLRVCLGIVESNLHFHPTEIETAEALGDSQFFTVRMSRIVKPTLIVEAHGLGNERVAFPLSYGISEPARTRFGRKAAPI